MGHSAAVWDYRAAIEITKDWNGIDQIVLRNPQGASARVRISWLRFSAFVQVSMLMLQEAMVLLFDLSISDRNTWFVSISWFNSSINIMCLILKLGKLAWSTGHFVEEWAGWRTLIYQQQGRLFNFYDHKFFPYRTSLWAVTNHENSCQQSILCNLWESIFWGKSFCNMDSL